MFAVLLVDARHCQPGGGSATVVKRSHQGEPPAARIENVSNGGHIAGVLRARLGAVRSV